MITGMKVAKIRTNFSFGMRLAAVFLIAIPASAQAAAARPEAEIDLEPLGVNVPAQGSVSATAMELLFLSDSNLVVLTESDRPGNALNARLILYEIGNGIVQQRKTLSLGEGVMPIASNNAGPKVLESIDSDHFVYWTYLGNADQWLCNSALNCRDTKQGPAPITLPHAGDCPSDDLLGFIDTGRAVCLVPRAHAKWSAIMMDSSGHHLHEIEDGVLPWDTRLVTSAEGQRFGLEWTSNTATQLLNPFACIDECPPPGRQQFVVFNSIDGTKGQSFEWDPRPYNLYVLPALSPSGKRAAFVMKDKLEIRSLEPTGTTRLPSTTAPYVTAPDSKSISRQPTVNTNGNGPGSSVR